LIIESNDLVADDCLDQVEGFSKSGSIEDYDELQVRESKFGTQRQEKREKVNLQIENPVRKRTSKEDDTSAPKKPCLCGEGDECPYNGNLNQFKALMEAGQLSGKNWGFTICGSNSGTYTCQNPIGNFCKNCMCFEKCHDCQVASIVQGTNDSVSDSLFSPLSAISSVGGRVESVVLPPTMDVIGDSSHSVISDCKPIPEATPSIALSTPLSIPASDDVDTGYAENDECDIGTSFELTTPTTSSDDSFASWRISLSPLEYNEIRMVVEGKLVTRRFAIRTSNAHKHSMFSSKKCAFIEIDDTLQPIHSKALYWYITVDAYIYHLKEQNGLKYVVLSKCFYQRRGCDLRKAIYVSSVLLTMCSNPVLEVVYLEWDYISRENEGVHFSPLGDFIKYIIQHDYVHVLHVDPGLSMAEARVVSVMQQQRRFYDKSRGIRISEKEDIWKLSDEQLTNSGYKRVDEAALENDELNWVGTRTDQSDRVGRNRTSQRFSTHKRDTDGVDQIRELEKSFL
jgi:hypothetical protein